MAHCTAAQDGMRHRGYKPSRFFHNLLLHRMIFNRLNVTVKGIGRNLYPIPQPTCDVLYEGRRSRSVTLPHLERQHQFGFRVYGTIRPHVSHLWVIIYADVALFSCR
jgi:hypothetical protein